MKSDKPINVGITLGDPAGIGPEIIIKALNFIKPDKQKNFTLIGDLGIINRQKEKLARRDIRIIDLKSIDLKGFKIGKINKASGLASMQYLEMATALIKAKEIDCLVTAPITKASVYLAGFNWPGHTEYLANKMGKKKFLMIFAHPQLRVSLVTRHIPLKSVAHSLTRDNLYNAITLTFSCLKEYFRIKDPSIAVCGLNPHAGEGALLGKEERDIIIPVIKRLRSKFKHLSGPHPADDIFLKNAKEPYDAIVSLYHDQGLIPLKLLGFDHTVNLTYGLGFVRTSPAHGSGLDIAGIGIASPASLISAINLAAKITASLNV